MARNVPVRLAGLSIGHVYRYVKGPLDAEPIRQYRLLNENPLDGVPKAPPRETERELGRSGRWLNSLSTVGRCTALSFLVGCGAPQAPEPGPRATHACRVLDVPLQAPGTLTVALLDDVDPGHAPHPLTSGEELVFRHLYETLVRVDCQGQVQPGLAASWRSDDGDRRWSFVLREGARFWDGSIATVGDVAGGWEAAVSAKAVSAAGIDSIALEGDETLTLYLKSRHRDVPLFLADPIFAVAARRSDSIWPLGTGPYRVEAWALGALVTRPWPVGERPVIRFRRASGADTRDLLREAVDLVVTEDPDVIEYARSRSLFDDVPLPWDRTYVLLSTTRARALRRDGDVDSLPTVVVDALARDAVRGDARGHRSPGWWDEVGACGSPAQAIAGLPPIPAGAYSPEGPRRIVFFVEDPTARDLAERIAALAAAGPSASAEASALASAVPGLSGVKELRAEGLDGHRYDESLRDGDDFAYVVALRRRGTAPCFEMASLIARAEWLAQEDVDLSSTLIPLVDTRRHAIVRAGSVALMIDWDGTVLIPSDVTDER